MRNAFIAAYLSFCALGCGAEPTDQATVTNVAGVDSETLSAESQQRPGEDWPQFLGPRADGTSAETGILTDWSDNNLKTLWTLDVGTSYGIGSIAAGRYLQFDRIGDKERLHAVRAATGETLWESTQPVQYIDTYGYNNGPRSSPVIDGNHVYTYGVAGRLTCRAVADGNVIWSHDLNKEFGVVQNFFGVGASPILVGDLVVVMVGGSPAEDQSLIYNLDAVRPNGSALVAFDKKSGEQRWRAGDYLASYSVPVVHTIDGTPMILAFVRGGLLACTTTGEEKWFYPWRAPRLESVNAMVPVRSGDEVFISECYDIGSSLLKVASDAVEPIWVDGKNQREQAFRAHWATPIKIGDYLYGCSGRNEPDADLRCIRWTDGKVMWTHSSRSRSSVMHVEDYLVVLDEYGLLELLKVNPEKREVVTSIDLSEPSADGLRRGLAPPCWAAPILSHGRLYVRGRDTVLCLDLIPQ